MGSINAASLNLFFNNQRLFLIVFAEKLEIVPFAATDISEAICWVQVSYILDIRGLHRKGARVLDQ